MLHICLLKTVFKNKLPAANGFHQLTPFPVLVPGTIAMQQSCGEQYNWNIAQYQTDCKSDK